MKIMHFHFGKDGGAERFFVHLVNALSERGVEQKVVIRPERGWRAKLAPEVDVIESHFRTASLDRILLPMRMKALAKRWQPDSILGWMPKGAKLLPDVAGPKRMVRLGDYPTSFKKFKNVQTVICNTPGIAAHVKEMGWQRDIAVVSNFTEASPAAPVDRSALNTPEGAFVISSMGRFVPRKGFDVLIRALARLPGAYLWLLGNGEEEGNLRALATELGVPDRLRFAGWQADPGPFVAASDCFAMASSHEPLGNVILEAWAQGAPVAATRAEGPSWFMADGENGLMVDIGDHEAMAAAIERIRGDKALAERLVAGGKKTLEGRFSRTAITDQYMAILKRS